MKNAFLEMHLLCCHEERSWARERAQDDDVTGDFSGTRAPPYLNTTTLLLQTYLASSHLIPRHKTAHLQFEMRL